MSRAFYNNPSLSFVDASLNHVDRLIHLDAICFTQDYWMERAHWEAYCTNAFFKKVLIANDKPDDNSNLVIANIVATFSEDNPKSVYIDSIAVMNEYRHRGIGKELFRLLIDYIENHNKNNPNHIIENIDLQVDRQNTEAKALYTLLCFSEIPEKHNEYQLFFGISVEKLNNVLQALLRPHSPSSQTFLATLWRVRSDAANDASNQPLPSTRALCL